MSDPDVNERICLSLTEPLASWSGGFPERLPSNPSFAAASQGAASWRSGVVA